MTRSALLRSLRQAVRRLRPDRQPRGKILAGGNPFEGRAATIYPNGRSRPVSGPACSASRRPRLHPFRCRCDLERALRQSGGTDARRLPILRALQSHRLRGQRQGVAQHHRDAGVAGRAKFELRTRLREPR
jgi:hypothetical protein